MQAHHLGVSAGRPCFLAACSCCHAHKTKLNPTFPHRAPIGLRLVKAHYTRSKSLLRVASTLEGDIFESNAGTKVVKVKFVLQRKCEFGQWFNVVGDDELFGAWNPEAAIPMQWSEGHIWAAELDISVGKRVEFKMILMGDQGVLEWQPGPNQVLEASEALSSLVISGSWSGEEDISQNDAPLRHVIEMSSLTNSQDLNELATSEELLPDLVEDIGGVETAIPATESKGVNHEDETDEEVTVYNGPVQANAEDLSVKKPVEFNVTLPGDDGALVERQLGQNHGLETSEASSSLVISESWSGEDDISQNGAPLGHATEMSSLLNSQDLIEMATSQELLPDLVEDTGGVETAIPATELEGVNEEESGEEVMVYNGPVEVNAEVLESEATNLSVENSSEGLEIKASVLEKDLRWGHKVWSKLWGALVQNHNTEA